VGDRITVEISDQDADRIAGEVFGRIQSMMESGEVPSYWVPKLLKLKTVAEILDMPLSKVHTKVKHGEIKSLRFDDKTLRVDPRELHRYIQAHPNLKVNQQAVEDLLDESRRLYF
jgi:hypothetical protein